MLACGCAWLRSRCAPLTAVATSLLEMCRLRRNAGLCLTRGMGGCGAIAGIVKENCREAYPLCKNAVMPTFRLWAPCG
jgi:hypothetical protein